MTTLSSQPQQIAGKQQNQQSGGYPAGLQYAASMRCAAHAGWDGELLGAAIVEVGARQHQNQFEDGADDGELPQPKAKKRQVANVHLR